MAYRMAGVREPVKEINIAEPYDPFAYKELHHLEGLQLAAKGQAPKLLADGVFDRDGDLPVTPSGGLLGVGNPIAAAGLMKICDCFGSCEVKLEHVRFPASRSAGSRKPGAI